MDGVARKVFKGAANVGAAIEGAENETLTTFEKDWGEGIHVPNRSRDLGQCR